MTTKLATRQQLDLAAIVPGGPLPSLVQAGEKPAAIAWDDFFEGKIRNRHTRLAYERHVRRFLAWAAANGRQGLHEITAGDVGKYIRGLAPERKSVSKKKQTLAALRKFFNLAVERHICLINAAAVAETEPMKIVEGKTPIITYEQVWKLYECINRETLVGQRDLAVLTTLNFSGARSGAVGALNVEDFYQEAGHWMLHFDDKGGKSREIPVPSDLEGNLLAWLESSGIRHQRRRRDPDTGQWIPRPLFRTFDGKTDTLTKYQHEKRDPRTAQIVQSEKGRMTGRDITRMMKRRLKAADLPTNLSPHSFRVAIGSDLDDQDVPLSDIQHYLGHSDPRTTQVYIRRQQKISRNLTERIRVGRVRRV